jgi:hypothetical protein
MAISMALDTCWIKNALSIGKLGVGILKRSLQSTGTRMLIITHRDLRAFEKSLHKFVHFSVWRKEKTSIQQWLKGFHLNIIENLI